MIRNKNDLRFYLDADRFALGKNTSRPAINDEVWRFQILLRKVEYYKNVKPSPFTNLCLRFYQLRKHRLGIKLGFDIPANVFGPGLRINHFGCIVVSADASVGMWCDIHQGVNIGTSNSATGDVLAPSIGHNVWIGPGATIYGNINVGNEVQIGANAVVNRDVDNRKTVAGVPARVVRDSGTESVLVAASRSEMAKFESSRPEYQHYFETPAS